MIGGMSVDMFEFRFRQELMKLPEFEPDDSRNPIVWRAEFPAWRALFTSLLLWGHSTGYRLPSYEDFYRYCRNAWCERHPRPHRFQKYFTGDLLPGMIQRTKFWYESGMAETHLYVCLAEALEDKLKAGIVLYDPRVDWKLKFDVFVLAKGRRFWVNAYHGVEDEREAIEARRDKIERIRKANTAESSHWGNVERDTVQQLHVAKTETDTLMVNGMRLFPYTAINRCLETIYDAVDISEGRVYFPMRRGA